MQACEMPFGTPPTACEFGPKLFGVKILPQDSIQHSLTFRQIEHSLTIRQIASSLALHIAES